MAYGGDVRKTIEGALGLPSGGLDHTYRVLRERGHLSTGGRGRSAARVTPRDAAQMLIAATCITSARDVYASWSEYSQLRSTISEVHIRRSDERAEVGFATLGVWDLRLMPELPLPPLGVGHTLVDALTALVTAAAAGTLRRLFPRAPASWAEIMTAKYPRHPNSLDIHMTGPQPYATISIRTPEFEEEVGYGPTDPVNADYQRQHPRGDLHEARRYTAYAIIALGELIAGDQAVPAAATMAPLGSDDG